MKTFKLSSNPENIVLPSGWKVIERTPVGWKQEKHSVRQTG
jgi:hypothetical protein